MPQHHNVEILPYSAEQICALIVDIERYPEFLPWCVAARIIKRYDWGCEAELVIGYKSFRESYISKVHIAAPNSVNVEMISGPFKQLINKWKLTECEGGVEVDFFLDFSFKSRLLDKAMGIFFLRATQKMTEAFKTRAVELYG